MGDIFLVKRRKVFDKILVARKKYARLQKDITDAQEVGNMVADEFDAGCKSVADWILGDPDGKRAQKK